MRVVRNSGFSLIELLLVIAVGTVLLVGGIGVYSMVTQKERAIDARRQIIQIKQGVKSMYTNGVYTPGSITAELGNSGKFEGMRAVSRSDPTHPQTPWGGTVAVSGYRAGEAASVPAFRIVFSGIPSSECRLMSQTLSQDLDLLEISVNETTLRTNVLSHEASEVTDAAVNDACHNFSSSGTIGWLFR